jgi:RNA polymerase sigma factor (sigma-70 family)
MTDGELLARYASGARSASEAAFAEIVRRHTDGVYAACLRVLGDPGLAQDAAQAVFLVLARKARSLGSGAVLAGWLFLAARQSALALGRREARRQRHEREAGKMRQAEGEKRDASWEEVRPQLDAAVAALPARQREAVVLCYLSGRTQAEAAAEMRCPQSTVSRRISAALEGLRRLLSRRGVELSAGTLGALLAEQAVGPAPAGLAQALQAVCAGQAAASPLVLSLSKGVTKAMLWMKIKTAALVAAATTVAAGGGALAVKGLSAEESARLPALAPAEGGVALTEASYWRCNWVWKAPLTRKGSELQETVSTAGGAVSTTDFTSKPIPPPEGWAQADFDDSGWSRWRIPWGRGTGADYGFGSSPAVAVQCLRGQFLVEDPSAVRGLTLSLAYRGGAVVYVNGRELARGHLPRGGKLDADTLAEDYPAEVFVHDGPADRGSNCIFPDFGHPAKYKDQLMKRVRRMENLAIDGQLLLRGVNVLAVELHRAPYYGNGIEKESMNHRSLWSPIGLVSLDLKAASGMQSSSRPGGVQVWNCAATVRNSPEDYSHPAEPLRPITIIAARNGIFDGKVVVSSAEALRGVKATVSDLTAKGGARIPATAVKVLYSVRDDRNALRYRVANGFWDTLLETPPAEVQPVKGGKGQTVGAIQPIVIKVRVPANAAPGDYQGKVAVSTGAGAATDVPVRLKVIDWQLPDPRDFETHMALVQSPDSVALEYKVPLWSEKHWALIEKSFELLGEVGGRYVCLPLICRTNFGNAESMVRWVKDPSTGSGPGGGRGGYSHDFSVFDRYLDLAQKHQKLDTVVVYVWDKYTGQNEWGRPGGRFSKPNAPVKVTLLTDPKAGTTEEMEGPAWSDPEASAFWKPVYSQVRARLEKRGLLPAMLIGISAEGWQPTKEPMELFKALLPGIRWVWNGHPQSPGAVGGIPVGYETLVYIRPVSPPQPWDAKHTFAWQNPVKRDMFPREGCSPMLAQSSPLVEYRSLAETALLTTGYGVNMNGLGRTGADFWAVLDPPKSGQRTTGKRSETVNGRYPESCWNQLNMNTATEALLAPGPDGAVTTERFENLREGVQEAAARIYIERALVGGKLDAALVRKCQEVLDERAWRLHSAVSSENPGWNWLEDSGYAGLREKLFSAAAEVAGKAK